MLLKREAIQNGVDAGLSLEDAAYAAAQDLADGADEAWQGRALAYLLLLAGGVFGLIGIPAAFEKIRSRFLLLAPVLLCLLCAAGAEAVCLYQGRGSSYSALAAGIFALVQLAVCIPRVKKKKRPKYTPAH